MSRFAPLRPRTWMALAAVTGLASACAFDDADGIGTGDTLLVPSDIELHWDGAFNATRDGLGAVVPVDVMVYDGATGEPREGVFVELSTSADSYLLRDGELARIDPETCQDCALDRVFWDAWHDAYYVLEVDLDVGRTRVRTDDEGIARVFVLVDAMSLGFEEDAPAFAPVEVQVETASADGGFSIIAR